MKVLRVIQTREQPDTAVLRNKEEFAEYFKRRYHLNKVETRGMEVAFDVLISWNVETIDWIEPQS